MKHTPLQQHYQSPLTANIRGASAAVDQQLPGSSVGGVPGPSQQLRVPTLQQHHQGPVAANTVALEAALQQQPDQQLLGSSIDAPGPSQLPREPAQQAKNGQGACKGTGAAAALQQQPHQQLLSSSADNASRSFQLLRLPMHQQLGVGMGTGTGAAADISGQEPGGPDGPRAAGPLPKMYVEQYVGEVGAEGDTEEDARVILGLMSAEDVYKERRMEAAAKARTDAAARAGAHVAADRAKTARLEASASVDRHKATAKRTRT